MSVGNHVAPTHACVDLVCRVSIEHAPLVDRIETMLQYADAELANRLIPFPSILPLLIQEVIVWNFANPSSATFVSATPSSPPTTTSRAPPTQKLATLEGEGHMYLLVAPVLAGGWAFLGETNKLTPVSAQRAFSFDLTSKGGLSVRMSGASGEKCVLAAWREGSVRVVDVTIETNGVGTIVFEP